MDLRLFNASLNVKIWDSKKLCHNISPFGNSLYFLFTLISRDLGGNHGTNLPKKVTCLRGAYHTHS